MNYQKIYEELINSRKDRILDGYTEKHHIIPKSLGGSNCADNMIQLTAREHFVAHWLLWKIHGVGPMGTAFWINEKIQI